MDELAHRSKAPKAATAGFHSHFLDRRMTTNLESNMFLKTNSLVVCCRPSGACFFISPGNLGLRPRLIAVAPPELGVRNHERTWSAGRNGRGWNIETRVVVRACSRRREHGTQKPTPDHQRQTTDSRPLMPGYRWSPPIPNHRCQPPMGQTPSPKSGRDAILFHRLDPLFQQRHCLIVDGVAADIRHSTGA